ncbi:MAG: hypothetical protein J0G30_05095 [Actinomycetales bacterium]|nr:hypothetical protein [Actinomycetales bacterium]
MPDLLLAGLGGLAAASTLLIGALAAWFLPVPRAVVAGIMAFGAGVLIATLAYSLVQDANEAGGILPTVGGFLAGAVLFVVLDHLVSSRGASRPARSGDDKDSSGVLLALGALIDGVPESIALGLTVASGGALSIPVLAAIAISNVPEGLSSSAAMKADGRTAGFVFGMWGGIAGASAIAALVGFAALRDAPPEVIAVVETIAAGGILAMVSNSMIPDAFRRDRALTGLIAAAGFVLAFVLHEFGG